MVLSDPPHTSCSACNHICSQYTVPSLKGKEKARSATPLPLIASNVNPTPDVHLSDIPSQLPHTHNPQLVLPIQQAPKNVLTDIVHPAGIINVIKLLIVQEEVVISSANALIIQLSEILFPFYKSFL
jgi:hypothetical protein